MFHAIRSWWTDGRGRLTARLFLFELLVVILGVLIAQALANEVQRHSQIAQMERSERLAQGEMTSNFGAALIWERAGPCLNDRLAEIMRRASTGPVPHALTVRPRIVQLAQTPLSTTDQLMIRDVKGSQRADFLESFTENVEDLSRDARELTEGWGRLELVDQEFGTVSPQDRVAARAAAADIRAHLRRIAIIGSDIVRESTRAGIRPDFGPAGNGPPETCDAIWTSGQINPHQTAR